MSEEDFSHDMGVVQTDGGRKKKKLSTNVRWSEDASRFMIVFLAGQIAEGVKGNLQLAAAKAVNEKFGTQFTVAHVCNHLRTWRNRWNRICRLKKLSGCVMWVPETRTIEMPDEEVYRAYIEGNKLDEPFLNKPIEFYDEMVLVFRGESASGKYAKDEPHSLGTSQDPTMKGSPLEAGKSDDPAVSMSVSQGYRGKGKRSNPQLEIFDRFADGLQKIGNCMYEKKEEENKVVADCFDCLQSMIGTAYNEYIFSEEVVSAAFDFIINNPKLGKGFLKRPSDQRANWLYRFMKEHNLG